MTQRRKAPSHRPSDARSVADRGERASSTPGSVPGASRPFTARSVVASTLLGIDPPRLPTRILVRSGELFGISPGTTRVALSRMVAAGELVVDGDGHRLAGHLLDRQARQRASRSPGRRPWDGRWTLAVVTGTRRPVAARAELRSAMAVLRLVEWREGVWLRPDNLDESWAVAARAVVATQCQRFVAWPESAEPAHPIRSDDPGAARELVERLWDLGGWEAQARLLRRRLAEVVARLDRGDADALAPGFVLSAEVLRHLLADPLLPPALLDPGWPGDELRAEYDAYDRTFKAVWRDWFRREVDR